MPCAANVRKLAIERKLKDLTDLPASCGIHPAPKPFFRQEEALQALQKLFDTNEYKPWQVGLFAEEVGEGGKRRFLVDTLVGFVVLHSPDAWPTDTSPLGHYYEVILQDRPCWLYFDLEYSIETNPELQPDVAMMAFEDTLSSFCSQVLGMTLDTSSILILESSTLKKFSKHVLVRRLLDASGASIDLAFANNAQIGLFVSELVHFARTHREDSSAKHLFVQPPKSDVPDWRETTMIDESVYSRNRSFRLLFQSKFGKDRRLDLDRSSALKVFENMPHPSVALLQSMVTFVPRDTKMFVHAIIPEGFGHMDMKAARVQRGGSVVVRSPDGKVGVAQQDPLLNHLVREWDKIREMNEKGRTFPVPTAVQSCLEMDQRFLTVTLLNNRFCLCKSSSHISNHVYMVVDKEHNCFHQKCFDPDCRGFASQTFAIPPWIFDNVPEEDLANLDSTEWEGFIQATCEAAVASSQQTPTKRKRISEGGA
mmetsp:Transcript_39133/g.72945  ORF Transcript_39133/g.72945 Transcript_39133/m.72945 type:complete len:481 (+) Transcript_39133:47-1489(+)